MKVLSAFGMGSRGLVDSSGALEREVHAGEVQSEHGVTKSTRGRYLWAREVTAELRVATASSSEAWATKSYGGGGSWLSVEDGRGGRDGVGLYRPGGER